MVTYPDINAIQQGLTSVNRREPVFPFGDSRTPPNRSLRGEKVYSEVIDASVL